MELFPNKYSTAFSPKYDHPIKVATANAIRDIPRTVLPKGIGEKAAVVSSPIE